MDYLSKGLKSVLSPRAGEDAQISGADTIDRLCDRITSSTLLEDRRDAVKAIRSLSKKYKLEVGTKAMDLLINVLEADRNDNEIVGMALDTLCNVMTTDSHDDVSMSDSKGSQSILDTDLGNQFTEIFLKSTENVATLLSLLEEYDFKVRWPTVKLLTILLQNRGIQIQQCVLVSPLGVSRLMDLLSDSREVVRNDGLLLLIQLTRGNAAIQKIVAFENAFDRLLEIISEEGYSDGGIVVEDCLLLLSNLLKSNVSNQTLYREGSYTQRLKPFFEFSDSALTDEAGWQSNKVNNVLRMLQLLRILVSPGNPPQATLSFQKVMNHCGLLKSLCDILMASGIPADILTETVNTVAEVIRGCQTNQDYFSEVHAPATSTPSRQAIVILLMSMINEKQPFNLRRAVLYCFQCYLFKNQKGQSQIISTLLPSTAEANVITAGQLLCAGLFSSDSFANWCAATAISHALNGNKEMKEQLLRVQLATGVGNAPISLLQQCMAMLSQGSKCVQTRAGLLALLCSWLYGCPIAVTHFLQNTTSVPFLISIVKEHGNGDETVVEGLAAILIGVCILYNDNQVQSFSKDEIKGIITTQIEIERFLSKINVVMQTECYTNALKSTQIQMSFPDEVLLDFEFVKLFKKLEGSISSGLQTDEEEECNEAQSHAKQQVQTEHNAIVTSYKELIREQDEQLRSLRSRCAQSEADYAQTQQQLMHQAMELTQLRAHAEISGGVSQETGESETQYSILQEQLKKLHLEISNRDEEIAMLNGRLLSNEAQLDAVAADINIGEVMTLESTEYTKTSQQLSNETMIELDAMRETVHILEQENATLRLQPQASSNHVEESSSPGITERVMSLEDQLKEKTEEYNQQKQDYEDLLVLLDDQDAKVAKYKAQLVQLGVMFTDEAEDNADEDEEEAGNGTENSTEQTSCTSDTADHSVVNDNAVDQRSMPPAAPLGGTLQSIDHVFAPHQPTTQGAAYPNDYLFGIGPPKGGNNAYDSHYAASSNVVQETSQRDVALSLFGP